MLFKLKTLLLTVFLATVSFSAESQCPIEFEVFTSEGSCVNDTNILVVNVIEVGGGPYSYQWYNNNGVVIGTEDSLIVADYENYTVQVSNGICTTSQDVEVDLAFYIWFPEVLETCIGAPINQSIWPQGNGVSPYTYSFNSSAPLSFSNSALISDIPIGSHDLVVIDANGCSFSKTLEVTEIEELSIDFLNFPTSCSGSNDGGLFATGNMGPQTHSFLWSTGDTIRFLMDLSPGEYQVTVTDYNGCERTGTGLVENGSMIRVNCVSPNGFLGSIYLYEFNRFSDKLFSWSTGETGGPGLSGLLPGNYSVTITDTEGNCEEVISDIYVCDNSQNITNDFDLCIGDSLDFNIVNPFGWTFISWSNQDFNGIDCDTCYNVTVSPDTSIVYNAAFSGPNGEIFFETFNVNVLDDCVWPGDVDTNLIVDHFDLLPLALSLDVFGLERPEMNIDFYGHESEDWSDIIQGYDNNQKHADCDGNRVVTYADTLAIIQNWGETYSRSGVNGNSSVDGIPIFLDIDTIPGTGISISIPLIIGTMDTMASDIYGLAFSINFDPEVIVDNSVSLNPIDSWMSEGIDQYIMVQKEFPTAGRLDVALSRTNAMNASGFGQVADFIIIMEDDILRSRAEDLEVEFSISNVKLINYQGEEIATDPKTTDVLIIDRLLDVKNLELSSLLEIYPNPANSGSTLQVQTDLKLKSFEILSVQGEVLMSDTFEGKNNIFISSSFQTGMYFFKGITKEGNSVIRNPSV